MKSIGKIALVTDSEYINETSFTGTRFSYWNTLYLKYQTGLLSLDNNYHISMILGTGTMPANPVQGQSVYNTTLNKPVWCKSGSKRVLLMTFNSISVSVNSSIVITLGADVKTITVTPTSTIETVINAILNTNFTDFIAQRERVDRIRFVSKLNGALAASATFDTGINLTVVQQNGAATNVWVEADAATAGVLRSGAFTSKPTSTDIYVGFMYFCTDKQTTEGATVGIPLFHKGSNVWVDCLGRVVS